MKYIPPAIMAGIFAASASVLGKFSMDESAALRLFEPGCAFLMGNPQICTHYLLLGFRIACFASVFACNSLMWVMFSKSLDLASSSLEATVVNSAANFIFTGLSGYIVLAEKLNLMWCAGTGCILIGITLITLGAAPPSPPTPPTSLSETKKDK